MFKEKARNDEVLDTYPKITFYLSDESIGGKSTRQVHALMRANQMVSLEN